jgi:hypothetical protein
MIFGKINNIDKKKLFEKMIPYLVLFPFIVIGLICNNSKEKKLINCHKHSIGKIVSVDGGGPSIPSGTRYSYFADGMEYIGLKNKCYYSLSRKKFPVIYSCKNPGYSKLLIEPADFEKYGYKFPDSLKWVLPLFEKE